MSEKPHTLLNFTRIGAGDPLVLVHGYLGGERMWKYQEELSSSFELIMPSLPGYGGMIAQEMAALYPTRVMKLILFGTGSIGALPNRFETIDESRQKILRSSNACKHKSDDEKVVNHELGMDVIQSIAQTWFLDYHVSMDGYNLCIQEGKKATLQAALASLKAWESWDGRDQLNDISAETLILWSTGDRTYDSEQQDILLRGIKGARLITFDNSRHNVHMERPTDVNSVIKEFLLTNVTGTEV